jgi:hypothetical protein
VYNGDYSNSPYGNVTDYWVFLHDDALAEPVLELACRYGWWPLDTEPPDGPGPTPANSCAGFEATRPAGTSAPAGLSWEDDRRPRWHAASRR